MKNNRCSTCKTPFTKDNAAASVIHRGSGGYCRVCLTRKSRVYYKQNSLKLNKYQKQWRKRIKHAVFSWYGGKCVCCGERQIDFLSLDHINDDGYKFRKYHITKTGKLYVGGDCGGIRTYTKIHKIGKQNKPKNLQLLCFNCQSGKRFNNGFCPHHPRIDLRI